MDTTTVLEIIKMINRASFVADMECNQEVIMDLAVREYYRGKVDAYDHLINHLQKFIEGQLNSAENNTVE
jgi:small nuclear ribonucleoprotein (snRNP)-like protein